MADFNFVTNRVATGAAITSENDMQQLLDAGVTHIIDCIKGNDDAGLLAAHPNVHYIYLGVDDDGQSKPNGWFQQGIEFALEGLSNPHTKIYGHCAAGINRGPSMVYAVLRSVGLTPELAEKLIRDARPQVNIAYRSDADRAIRELGYE